MVSFYPATHRPCCSCEKSHLPGKCSLADPSALPGPEQFQTDAVKAGGPGQALGGCPLTASPRSRACLSPSHAPPTQGSPMMQSVLLPE